jgi:phosphatidylserine/phosphatidylglycerophosphate/cardiolipin synthase-like enzyme
MVDYKEMRIAFTWPEGPIPDGFRDLESTLEKMISSAVDTIDIMTYSQNTDVRFVLNRSIEQAIRKNKPKIRIFTDSKTDAEGMLERYTGLGSELECWYWNQSGNPYSKFHIKAILVDNFRVYMGSANFSETAMEASAECGAFFRSREAATSLRHYITGLIDCGRIVRA